MRRLIVAISLILFICVTGALAILFVMRDQLLLREMRIQASRLEPLRVEIGSLHTRLFGAFAVELGDVVVEQDKGASVKLREVRVSSHLGILGLYRAYSQKEEIPLAVDVHGLKAALAAPSAPAESSHAPHAAAASAWPPQVAMPAASPVPVRVEFMLDKGEVSGPAVVKNLHAKASVRARDTGLEASFSVGFHGGLSAADALLPVSLDGRVAASHDAVKLLGVTFKTAGLDGSASGELALSPAKGKFQAALDVADLSRVSLRPEDKASLGLTGQPAGAVQLKLDGGIDAQGSLTAVGELHLRDLVLPLRAPEKTAFSNLARGQHIDGPVSLHADVPFQLRASLAAPAPASFYVQKAAVGFDLTQASLVSKGLLEKPRGTPLRGEAVISSSESGVEISNASFTFHNLGLSANATLPVPLGASAAASFRVNISSLAGFPSLLPMLREAAPAGAAVADAQGSVAAEGNLSVVAAEPGKALVDLRTFNVKSLRLPLAWENESLSLQGVATGGASGGVRYDAGDIAISRTSGSFDLTALDISLPGKFAKKRGRKLVLGFDAQGTPARLQVRRASLAADGLTASLAGTAAFDARRNANVNLTTTAHAELALLREYLPKLGMKVSGGVFDSNLKISGQWLPAGGVEKSPLAVSGKVTGKLQRVEMPEPPHAEASTQGTASIAKGPSQPTAAASPQPMLPNWPVARNANVSFRFDLGEFKRGALVASGVAATGTLSQGSLTGAAGVNSVFGGKATLTKLSATLLTPKLAVHGAAGVDGLDLASAAAFVDPSYGKIVKGTLKADSTFAVPDALGDVLGTAIANGTAQIHNGYLSTATFDGLLNAKLKAIPGLGDKAKVNTGGVAAEIRTGFSVLNGTATLRDFVAATPARDEMDLAGSMNLAFDCDLSGTAHLANAPVSGPVREANSDPQGRLVVPVRFHGNLKAPQADIATGAIEEMLKKTASHEFDKRKNQAIDEAKKKAQSQLQDAAGGLLDQLKKGVH